jgi:hypothetical protein
MLSAVFFIIGIVLIAFAYLGIAFLNQAGIVFNWFSSLQTKLGFKKFLTIFAIAQVVVLGIFCLLDWFLGMIIVGALGVFAYKFVIARVKKAINALQSYAKASGSMARADLEEYIKKLETELALKVAEINVVNSLGISRAAYVNNAGGKAFTDGLDPVKASLDAAIEFQTTVNSMVRK